MSASVYSMLTDPVTGAVVSSRWIGGSSVRDRVREVLQRPPDHQAPGFLAWGHVTVAELAAITDAHYDKGLAPSDVDRLAQELPADRFWWAIWIDH
jgi:hypothetical protein